MDISDYELQSFNSNFSNYASDEFLHINSCGISRYSFTDKKTAIREYRPDGRVDYHILYTVRGKMQVSVNGITREMLPGDAVFYMPDTPHEYIYFIDEEHPVCQSLYIHFSGSSAKEAVESAGIKDSCFAPSVGRRLGRLIVSLITDYRVGNKLSACGQLLSILPLLTKKSASSPSENLQRIHRQVEYIGIHFAEEIDLDKCAAKEGLSRSRFSHIFTDYMGVSPYKYQLSLRLDKAKELLLESSLSVGEISASVGFSDPLYFSRLFRKNFGISPSKFKVKNNQDG